MELIVILLRFFIVFVFSLVFGLERQRSHKPIGFGTFTFVSIGACGLGITSILLNAANPLPLLGSIITGIGFLGAGALIKTTDKIFGFTTAASIWILAIIGLAIGVGEYVIAIIMYSLVWLVIFIDKYLEKKGIGSYQNKITLVTNKIINANDIKSSLGAKVNKIVNMDINRKENKCSITILVEGDKEHINEIPKKLFKNEWLDSFKVE
ncbi:MgtC/SapB family protein [Candidatus Woesearchaeota archaeon]|nr:MgtC/SapB family protein [Candidatus Woesearchaeota archaeon]